MTLKNTPLAPTRPWLLPRPAWDAAERGISSSNATAAVYAAAVLSLVAALVHLWVAPGHFEVWWGSGAFFLAAAAAQGLFAVALLRWPGRAALPLCSLVAMVRCFSRLRPSSHATSSTCAVGPSPAGEAAMLTTRHSRHPPLLRCT